MASMQASDCLLRCVFEGACVEQVGVAGTSAATVGSFEIRRNDPRSRFARPGYGCMYAIKSLSIRKSINSKQSFFTARF
jgi:hypothetical protein